MTQDYIEIEGQRVSENVYLCADGKYRWSYEFKMMKNPVIFLTVLKVLGLAAAIVAVFTVAISLKDWIKYGVAGDSSDVKILLILVAVFLGLTFLSYVILAALYGWKYMVLFEMDETEIRHIQLPKQVKKAQAIGILTALVGLASHNPTTAGVGLTSTAKSTSTSEWERVKKVKCRKRLDTIYVVSGLDHNQIYAEPADFDFVKDFIVSHCAKAKIS